MLVVAWTTSNSANPGKCTRLLGVKRWERMVVAKIEDDQVILRLRGLTELVRVERAAMQNPERFRRANW